MLPRKLCLHFPESNSKMSGSQLELRPSIHYMVLSGKALLWKTVQPKLWTGRHLNSVTNNPLVKCFYLLISAHEDDRPSVCMSVRIRSEVLLSAARLCTAPYSGLSSDRAGPSEQRGFSLWPWHTADSSPQEPALRNPPWHWYQSPCVPLAAQGWGVEANAHHMEGFYFQWTGLENNTEAVPSIIRRLGSVH